MGDAHGLGTDGSIVKFLPKHHYYRPQKITEIPKKKIVRNFLTNLKFFIFFEFFSENILKTLLRGRETTRKKYRIVFEKLTFFEEKSKKTMQKKSCAKFFNKFNCFY